MKAIYKNIDDFSIENIIENELPYTSMFYYNNSVLDHDIQSLFSFPLKNKNNMPFYTIRPQSQNNIMDTYNNVYGAMIHALDYLFNNQPNGYEVSKKYFGEEFMTKFPYFWEYAKHTFNQNHPAIYGRFDSVMNPVTEKVTGIYEFNGDTPVMLFESVNLENNLVSKFDSNAQLNGFYELLQKYVKDNFDREDVVGVVFDPEYVEDTVTCETLNQIFSEENLTLYGNLTKLDYENNNDGFPFFLYNQKVNRIFILKPWEEMVEAYPKAFQEWASWCDTTFFMEPAWRWFMSNKGFMSYMTHLIENVDCFSYAKDVEKYPFIKTYENNDYFVKNNLPYVKKPKIGRLSNNIQIFDKDNKELFSSDGTYGDVENVYQSYLAPNKVDGRNNFIACMWMAPIFNEETQETESIAATFCIREFDNEVLSIKNERFIPHIVQE